MFPGFNAYKPIQIYQVANGWIVEVKHYQGNPFSEMAKSMAKEMDKDKMMPDENEVDLIDVKDNDMFIFSDISEVLAFLQKTYMPIDK